MGRWGTTISVLGFAALGSLSANALVSQLELSFRTEREYLVSQVSQSLKPQTVQTLQLQNAIYEQRVASLETKIEQIELKKQSVEQYLQPLEQEVVEYRQTFQQQAAASQDERLQLYIDLVQKYRDYHRALSAIENFVPLQDSDSLLTHPSVQLDLIYRVGGDLARVHNAFIEEPRDSIIASHYEPSLRRFFSEQQLDTVLIECHQTLCGVHLGHVWEDPYYQGFRALWQSLNEQPWMDLQLRDGAHQYRGRGHQIQVWYLQVPG